MFERFTERARQAVVLAQEEARGNKNENITVPLLFAGVIREEEGLAARVLETLGVTSIEQVRPLLKPGNQQTTGQLPFTPNAKKALEIALREALGLGHNYIGTEHILLALVRSAEENADGLHTLWTKLGLVPGLVRTEMIRMLEGPRGMRGYSVAKPVEEKVATADTWIVLVDDQTASPEFSERPTFDITSHGYICFECAGGPLLIVVPEPNQTIVMKKDQ